MPVNEYIAEQIWRRQFGHKEDLHVSECARAIQRSETFTVALLNKLAKIKVVHLSICFNGKPVWYYWGKGQMPAKKFKKSESLDCSDTSQALAKQYGL